MSLQTAGTGNWRDIYEQVRVVQRMYRILEDPLAYRLDTEAALILAPAVEGTEWVGGDNVVTMAFAGVAAANLGSGTRTIDPLAIWRDNCGHQSPLGSRPDLRRVVI